MYININNLNVVCKGKRRNVPNEKTQLLIPYNSIVHKKPNSYFKKQYEKHLDQNYQIWNQYIEQPHRPNKILNKVSLPPSQFNVVIVLPST